MIPIMSCFENSIKMDVQSTKFIRLAIFYVAGVCAGVPALLCALRFLYRHHKSTGRISITAVFLLLSDVLEIILCPVHVTYMFQKDSKCVLIFKLLFGARLCGHLLHQTVALENISQKYPSLANVFSRPCSMIICIVVFLITIGCIFTEIWHVVSMLVCSLPVPICFISYLLVWKAPQSEQATDRKSDALLITVAMFTLVMLYIPFFLTVFTDLPFNLDSLASLRLISDPLLCALVCRQLDFSVTRSNAP